jgi:DNA-directed RNA polymerase specialized sigma24 family protein
VTAARLDALRCHLELLGALHRAERLGRPSRLSVKDWQLLLRPLNTRQRRVVVLRCLAGMQLRRVAVRLGMSTSLAGWHWKRAIGEMKKFWDWSEW